MTDPHYEPDEAPRAAPAAPDETNRLLRAILARLESIDEKVSKAFDDDAWRWRCD